MSQPRLGPRRSMKASAAGPMDIFGVRRSSTNEAPPPRRSTSLPISSVSQAVAPMSSPFGQSLDRRVVKAGYSLGETLPGGETSTIEFKSCQRRASHGGGIVEVDEGGEHAIMLVKTKVGRYISAFLNGSSGGTILFGIEDDGRVTGMPFSESIRVALIKGLDAAIGAIDPQVEVDSVTYDFAPALHGSGATETTSDAQ